MRESRTTHLGKHKQAQLGVVIRRRQLYERLTSTEDPVEAANIIAAVVWGSAPRPSLPATGLRAAGWKDGRSMHGLRGHGLDLGLVRSAAALTLFV